MRTRTAAAVLAATGALLFGYVWMTLHGRAAGRIATAYQSSQARFAIEHWIRHGYFASFGLVVPTEDERLIYRSFSGAHLVSGFVVEKLSVLATGRVNWPLLGAHNDLVALAVATLAGLLAVRLALLAGAEPRLALAGGVAVQFAHFTFPDELAVFWIMSEKLWWLGAALVFLLLEERAAARGRTRRLDAAQALAMFGMTYVEHVCGTMFLLAYVATVLLLREERPPLRRLFVLLALPWAAAFALFAAQLTAAHFERQHTGARLVGSGFLYRTGLDGDTALYRDPLDIAYGRAIVRGPEPERRELFRWPLLFAAGAIALLASIAAYIFGRRAPRLVAVSLVTLTATYLLTAAALSQAVAMHPYLYDIVLATPLMIALFATLPALLESMTRRTGAFTLIALFAAAWLTGWQLRVYAMAFPS